MPNEYKWPSKWISREDAEKYFPNMDDFSVVRDGYVLHEGNCCEFIPETFNQKE